MKDRHMASIKSNVKNVKTQVLKMLSAGLASDFISKTCNVSPTTVKEWEEEYLRDVLASGAGQRIRLRNLLLRNAPQMINTLYKLAMQDVDTKMQMGAASTFLSFASRFLKEDASIASAEAKATEVAKGNISQTLFDFVIPGETQELKVEGVDGGFFGEIAEEGEESEEEEEISPDDLGSYYSGNSEESMSDDILS